jgi:tRNA uridine 5-carboxymethylaminomethyl modification enzyme
LQAHESQIERGRQALSSQFHQGAPLEQFLRRTEVDWSDLCSLNSEVANLDLSPRAAEQIALEAKYAGYIRRQQALIEKQEQSLAISIPERFDYGAIPQLRAEAKQKLARILPRNLAQASRISGITPSDIAILILYIKEPHRLAS